jgi:serine-type D-Ala-D-Ala carboxypeptidase
MAGSTFAGSTFPGAALLVSRAGRVVFRRFVGRYRGGDPLDEASYTEDNYALQPSPNTLFDLASLTKPLATAVAVLRLVDEGRLSLEEELRELLGGDGGGSAGSRGSRRDGGSRRGGRGAPGALPAATGSLTLRRLLTHTGGLPAVPGLTAVVTPRGGDYTRAGGLPDREEIERAWAALYRTDALAARDEQVLYSCTGFVFLGEVVAATTGLPFPEAFRRLVVAGNRSSAGGDGRAARDGAGDSRGGGAGGAAGPGFELGFLPPAAERRRCAPTENDPWRGRRIQGEVHDENAYALGGAAGNAGLFATVDALHEHILRIWGGVVGAGRLSPLLSEETATEAAREQVALPLAAPLAGREAGEVERRGLGVQLVTPEIAAETGLSCRAFGHTGFTGTSFEIDPERSLLMVALTNRVYYGREKTDEAIRRFRLEFYRRAVEEFG